MEDAEIVDLYWSREERAIQETDRKYGRMLYILSDRILRSPEDAEECLNDAYVSAWNSMPSNRPTYLGSYMAKIIRNLSLNRYERNLAQKRGGNVVMTELSECIPGEDPEETLRGEEIRRILNRFLEGLDKEKRVVFVKRYFFSESLAEISAATGLSEGKIKSILFRLRQRLKQELKEVEL